MSSLPQTPEQWLGELRAEIRELRIMLHSALEPAARVPELETRVLKLEKGHARTLGFAGGIGAAGAVLVNFLERWS